MAKHTAKWKNRPDSDDFTAALNYLTLQFPAAKAKHLVAQARNTKRLERIAKDILRASNLPLLPREELHVAENIKKIHKGKPLSPIVLVQGDLTKSRPFIIADGYHRMCAACHEDEDAPVAAVMVKP
jgi:hypothetical protein